ncbi:fumarylacetoacetate hydrolase family protein, partial [Rhizobium ruizarguesonis]
DLNQMIWKVPEIIAELSKLFTLALDCIYGYAVCIDFTRRDLQGEAKKLGRPWEVGKAFEHSSPVSSIIPASRPARACRSVPARSYLQR